MSDARIRRLLWIIAAAMLASIGLFLLDQPYEEPKPMPRDGAGLAVRLATHPTDWRAASAIADHILDEDYPGRIEAWRAAEALTLRLSPNFLPGRSGYIRGGLFHWYELGDADRRAVLAALTPLMHDPETFQRMVRPIFELTGNLAFLRATQPHTLDSLETLQNLAVRNGLFEDYRALRGELVTTRTRALIARLSSLPPSQIVTALPLYPTTDDQPMIAAALQALQERPLEVDCGDRHVLEALIDYAVRHRLPLDGLRPVTRERTWVNGFARGELARALRETTSSDDFGMKDPRPARGEVASINGIKWDGACGPGFCGRTGADIAGPRQVTIESVDGDEIAGYIEWYVDDARVWEGPLLGKVTLSVGVGEHRVEIRLVNPVLRNQGQRHFRIE